MWTCTLEELKFIVKHFNTAENTFSGFTVDNVGLLRVGLVMAASVYFALGFYPPVF